MNGRKTIREIVVVPINLVDAQARLSELVERAANGETIYIFERGKRVAKLIGPEAPKRPVDLAALRQLIASMPRQVPSAGEFVRRMRDTDRY